VSGLDFSQLPHPGGDESLELFDLETASRRLLDGPLADRSYHDIRWSADGQRLGYIVRPREQALSPTGNRYDLYVNDVASGEARSIYQFEGGQYDFAYFDWSPSGAWVLVKISRGGELSPEEQRIAGADFSQAWELVLVNVESGQARQIVSGQELLYATGWTANRAEDSFTYVANGVLYLDTVDGDVRELARAAGDDCPFCLRQSFGWSPDGRYLGLWNIGGGPGDSGTIAVLDVTTGDIQTLVQVQEEGVSIWNPQWWR
jgi:Tol biopolymer transport system component